MSETKTSLKARALVPPKELAIFCRQMALVIGSDITLSEGVRIVEEQSDHKALKKAIAAMGADMNERGFTFAQAMALQPQAFPAYLANMVTLGEQSGNLDVVLTQMADYYEKEHRMQRRVRAAVTYPAMLTVLMLAVIALLVLRILPMFEQILINMGGTLPTVTRVMMNVARFIGHNIWWMLAILALAVVQYILYAGSAKGRVRVDGWKLRMPLVGNLQRRILTARFGHSLAILLKSGVPLIGALDAVGPLLGNEWLHAKLKGAQNALMDGKNFVDSVKEIGIFPPLFLRLVVIGESTGRLDEMLFRAAGFFDDEVDEALERLTNAIEPILIIILSVIVGIILLSVMLPMINIMARIG